MKATFFRVRVLMALAAASSAVAAVSGAVAAADLLPGSAPSAGVSSAGRSSATATTSPIVRVSAKSSPADAKLSLDAAKLSPAGTQPSASAPVPPPPPMPAEFSVLTVRSIFQKGAAPLAGGAAGAGPSTQQSARPEKSLVLDGVANDGGIVVAFVEDRTAQRVTRLKAGDAVASGRVGKIAADGFDYETAGGVVRVNVGHDLDGDVAPPPAGSSGGAPTSAAGTSASGGPDGSPVAATAGSSGAAGPSAGGGIDVIERMRQRRARELGQR